MTDPDPTAWGYIDDGVFYPVPKGPLAAADLTPPCTVHLWCGQREIIRDPGASPEGQGGLGL